MGDKLLTIKDTAEYLGVHWQTVRNYIRRGTLKAHKVGRVVRIKESELSDFLEDKKRAKEKVEIEIRFVIKNRKRIEKKLLKLGAKLIYHGHVIDHWYNPSCIKSMKQKEEYYDTCKGYGLRIREQDNGYTGKVHASLEVKRLLVPYKHDTCIEAEIDISDFEETDRLLELMNFKEMIAIDKDRVVYKYKDFKVAIDEIKDFLTGVEVEVLTSENRKVVIPKLKRLARELGLNLQKEMTDKSVTYLAMKKFAKF